MAPSAALAELGAVGHISGHHFDAQGRHLHTPLCDRTIAVDPERMRSIPLVVGVAWGADKLPALRGAPAAPVTCVDSCPTATPHGHVTCVDSRPTVNAADAPASTAGAHGSWPSGWRQREARAAAPLLQ